MARHSRPRRGREHRQARLHLGDEQELQAVQGEVLRERATQPHSDERLLGHQERTLLLSKDLLRKQQHRPTQVNPEDLHSRLWIKSRREEFL